MDSSSSAAAQPTIVTVRPDQEVMTLQKLPYFIGVSSASAGARAISMNMVVIPPGGSAEPHFHEGFETAIYLIKGRVLTRFGEGLKQETINESGDFLFIPASLPHQPVNLSDTEAAVAIVARNVADEQESVVHYDAAAGAAE